MQAACNCFVRVDAAAISHSGLRRHQVLRPCACQGCYAQSDAKATQMSRGWDFAFWFQPGLLISASPSLENLHARGEALTWSRCDLCDFALCHHCVAWRARGRERAEAAADQTPPVATPCSQETQSASPSSIGLEAAAHKKWFDGWASQMNAKSAQWELLRGGEWVPFGIGLNSKLADAVNQGLSSLRYVASSKQEHMFDFEAMEQINLDTGKRRSLRRVLWEVELDLGWVLVEDDLALQLQTHCLRDVPIFEYFARGMQYTINALEMYQLNEELGTKRSLRKVLLQEMPPRMSRQELRMALEDDFSKFACAMRQWLMMRWPWQQIGDCSIDACQFVETELAEEIASGLAGIQEDAPQLGGILQNIVWFDYVDQAKSEHLRQAQAEGFKQTPLESSCWSMLTVQVIDAIVHDPRWQWARAGTTCASVISCASHGR